MTDPGTLAGLALLTVALWMAVLALSLRHLAQERRHRPPFEFRDHLPAAATRRHR